MSYNYQAQKPRLFTDAGQREFLAIRDQLEDLAKPKAHGEPVNVHVVEFVVQPGPDFAAMQRAIESRSDQSPPRREPEK